MRGVFGLVALCAAFSATPSHASAVGEIDLEATRATYFRCMEENPVKLGRGNQETAETILKAVRTICEAEDRALGFAYFAANKRPQTYMGDDRKEAEGKAVTSLLIARSK